MNVQVINIYNASPGATYPGAGVSFLCSLAATNFLHKTILAGDFNLHHPSWHPSYHSSPSTQAEDLVRWIESRNYSLASDIDVPTHNRGNVLDLCFCSSLLLSEGISASVQHDHDVGSDHFPLCIKIPCQVRRKPPAARLRVATIHEETFFFLLAFHLASILPLTDKSRASLDCRAEKIIHILYSCFSGSAKSCLPHNRGQPWWNQDCKVAKKKHRDISRTGYATFEDKKAFRKVIKKAKIAFYRKIMDEAASAKDVFNIAKWHKSRGKFTSPPLKDPNDPDGPLALSPESKGDLLARCLLANQSEVEDIPLTSPAVANASLPFPKLTSELSRAIVGANNTPPGKDRIPTAVLRLAWPKIADLVLDLFQACLDTGHHPKCFRTAILAIIENPNKLDMSSPRSYRPIALLSVLGKGLERLVARRMLWIAIKHKLLTRQQFGALPLRSSADLTTCLTHDIENALARGETASIATLDSKGAFSTLR